MPFNVQPRPQLTEDTMAQIVARWLEDPDATTEDLEAALDQPLRFMSPFDKPTMDA